MTCTRPLAIVERDVLEFNHWFGFSLDVSKSSLADCKNREVESQVALTVSGKSIYVVILELTFLKSPCLLSSNPSQPSPGTFLCMQRPKGAEGSPQISPGKQEWTPTVSAAASADQPEPHWGEAKAVSQGELVWSGCRSSKGWEETSDQETKKEAAWPNQTTKRLAQEVRVGYRDRVRNKERRLELTVKEKVDWDKLQGFVVGKGELWVGIDLGHQVLRETLGMDGQEERG